MRRSEKLYLLIIITLLILGFVWFVQAQTSVTGTFDVKSIDPTTSAVKTIDSFHSEIHEGEYYTLVHSTTSSAATPQYIYLKTPNTTVRHHFVARVTANNSGKIEFFEAATVTVNGVAITPYNNNRNSANVTSLLAFKIPTVTVDGTKLLEDFVGSSTTGAGGSRIGGAARTSSEYILKQNTAYVIKWTADNNSTMYSVVSEWYEP